MAIINISSVSVVKGTPATITLDKAALAALPIVSGDAYFSVQANWYEVIVYYVSTEGHQKESLVFDASLASPTADFYVTSDARDVFDVQNLVIRDFNNGYLNITRDELIAEGVDVAADFDVDFGGGPTPSNYIVWDYLGAQMSAGPQGSVIRSAINESVSSDVSSAYSTTSQATGDFVWEFTLRQNTGSNLLIDVGIRKGVFNGSDFMWSNMFAGIHWEGSQNAQWILNGGGFSPMPSTLFTLNADHVIKFVLTGTTLRVYIDNTLVQTQLSVIAADCGGAFRPYLAMRSENNISTKSESLPPVAAYRYIKFAGKQGWDNNVSNNLVNNVSFADFALKWGGVNRNLASYTVTPIYSVAGAVPSFGALTDGIINDSNNYVVWSTGNTLQDLFSVDLTTSQPVSDILIAPQYGGGTLGYNLPKEFKVYGSSDGISYTEILSVNQADSSTWAGTGGTYVAFPV